MIRFTLSGKPSGVFQPEGAKVDPTAESDGRRLGGLCAVPLLRPKQKTGDLLGCAAWIADLPLSPDVVTNVAEATQNRFGVERLGHRLLDAKRELHL